MLTAPALAQSPQAGKLDEAVRKAVSSGESARVIIQFESSTERDAAFDRLLDRGAAVRTMDTEAGPALNVLSSAAALQSEVANAAQVSIDAPVSVFAVKQTRTPARAAAGKPPASAANRKSRYRSSLSVAVIDSGIQPQTDLPSWRIVAYKDFVTGGSKKVDLCGHGTHVAGTIAGSGEMSDGEYSGVDPNVDLVILRVLGNDCSGNTSDVIDALEWVGKNHTRYGIRVVNLSLGHPVFESVVTDPMVQAVERLSRKGIVVVTAAGNMGISPKTGKPGYGTAGVPCNAPSAVCVGALNTQGTAIFGDDDIAPFSSRGPTRFDLLAKPDVVADGVGVIAAAARGSRLYGDDDDKKAKGRRVSGTRDTTEASYLRLSGTSMAAPRVAGAAALMLTANRRLSANTVKLALQYTARVVPGVDTLTQGAGALNTLGAVKMAQRLNSTAPVGESWLTASLPKSNLDENGQRVKWGRRVVWGDRFAPADAASVHMARWDDNIVWGFDALAENIVWGNCDECDNIVWGNHWDDTDNIVWGNAFDDNIVWGENIVWGDNIVWGYWADNIVWGFWDENIVWGNVTRDEMDNIVWGNDWDNIVWGNCSRGQSGDDNIVWGNSFDDNIVWGFGDDNIVWGNCSGNGSGNGSGNAGQGGQ